ncbi:MAG TPA: Rne/Rng family ribonuclease [Flavobacteriales bacterium]|nr:Rne/Rng family ribonuclease [Flavobacteriales bacterium]
MSIDLIIKGNENGVELALLQERKLIEFHREKDNSRFNVGDIYLGKVKKIVPGLNAAFVHVGFEKDAFLHYLDLGPQFASLMKFLRTVQDGKQESSRLAGFKLEHDIDKEGKITQVLSSGQNILIQIAKEPISSKGPRLTAEITIPGRYLVLVPFSNKISISQKVKSKEERDRLRQVISSIRPHNFGVIIRTVAENKKVAELEADIKDLMKKWDECIRNIKNASPPKRVLGEIDKRSALLRDMLNENFNNIFVDTPQVHDDLKQYILSIAPGKEKILKMYQGTGDIFENFNIYKQIKSAFGKQVFLQNGGYLIIEHTEAMHVIDVNSGNRKNNDKTQEENALEVNLEAAAEIARVMRLRDMGGIIAVDFIDMHEKENNHKLYEFLKAEMKSDRAKHSILPPSRFGVVEITRQRVKPVTDIDTTETCPSCSGSGKIEASVLVSDEIENNIRYLSEQNKGKNFTLTLHPYLAAYFTKGFFNSKKRSWKKKYRLKINVEAHTTHHLLEYHFYDENKEEIVF